MTMPNDNDFQILPAEIEKGRDEMVREGLDRSRINAGV